MQTSRAEFHMKKFSVSGAAACTKVWDAPLGAAPSPVPIAGMSDSKEIMMNNLV